MSLAAAERALLRDLRVRVHRWSSVSGSRIIQRLRGGRATCGRLWAKSVLSAAGAVALSRVEQRCARNASNIGTEQLWAALRQRGTPRPVSDHRD